MDTYTTWAANSTTYAAYQAASTKCAAAFATPSTPAPVVNAWTHPGTGETRYYVNNIAELIGLDIARYNTGNISSAALNGDRISNSQANKILGDLRKVYLTTTKTGVKITIQSNWSTFQNREISRDEVRDIIHTALSTHHVTLAA